MQINACTQRLGDTIHAYAVTLARVRQGHCQHDFRIRADYADLFWSSPVPTVRQQATWWHHDGSFHGPRHNQHVRDTMAACAGVDGTDLTLHLPMPRSPHPDPGDYIVVCPHAATHATYKEWPLGRWAAIIETITALGVRALVCGMPGREPLKLPISATSLTLDPASLGSLLAGATALIGPDSGHIHLADAVGTQVIGLYAATSTCTYGPYRDNRHCIDHHHAVFPARAAYDSGKHLRNACMRAISVEEVADRVVAVCGPRQPPAMP